MTVAYDGGGFRGFAFQAGQKTVAGAIIEAANTAKLAVYISESRERGIAVRPPDINESQLHFTVVPEGVRFGLTALSREEALWDRRSTIASLRRKGFIADVQGSGFACVEELRMPAIRAARTNVLTAIAYE